MAKKITKSITDRIRNLGNAVIPGTRSRIARRFSALHPRDQARHLERQKEAVRRRIYGALSASELAELLEHIELRERVVFFEEIDTKKAAEVLAAMYVDDAVDIIRLLERDQSVQYINQLEEELVEDIRELMHYKEASAGSLMTTEFITVRVDQTVGEALEQLRQQAEYVVTIYYVFVVDSADTIVKVVSLKQLLIARKNRPVGEIGSDEAITVHAEDSKVEVARVMKEYNFLAVPVVDDTNKILGVITIDDVVDVIDELAADRYSKLAAATDIELTDGPLASARKRLPWLILLLFLGMITATLIGQFEDTIAQVAILGAFIPVVAGTTGNSGTQSLAIVVRGIATGKLDQLSLKRYFLKEGVTSLVISIICGLVLTGIVYVWKQELFIGLVAGVSLTFSIAAGTLVGSVVPLVLRRFRADPAVASGPLITTICDILSMGIYFGIATTLMSHLV